MVTAYLLAIVLCLISAAYAYLKWIFSFWRRQGVPHEPPHLFWGNLKGVGKEYALGGKVQSTYALFSGQSKVCGMYLMTKPLAVICDLDLVKTVLIKDFNKFSDRGWYFNEKDDPLSANLLTLPGPRWKFLRAKLSPAFSSGRLKTMTPIVAKLGEKLVEKIRDSEGVSLNAGDMFSRYTTDVIGNCAFGMDCNSLEDPTSEFLEKGKMVFRPAQGRISLKRIFVMVFGTLSRRLGLGNTQSEVNRFFYNVARQSVDYREKEDKDNHREDFLNALIQMKKNAELTFDEVAAQMFIFQLAGYETSSTTLTYVAYELAMNPEIQERLREEINEVVERHGGVSYEAIFDMPYLDCVINEALRKYPPGRLLIRRMNQESYTIPGTEINLKLNDLVAVSIHGIQHDPLIYPQPDVFDPERFRPAEVQKRHSMSFLAFGEGNRNCIGLRFAMMEIKLALAQVLMEFRLERGTDLPEKLEFLPRGIILAPSCDINIMFKEL